MNATSTTTTTATAAITTTNNSSVPAKGQNTATYNSSSYSCNICGFASTRVNVMIFHRKTHSNAVTPLSTTTTTTAAATITPTTPLTTKTVRKLTDVATKTIVDKSEIISNTTTIKTTTTTITKEDENEEIKVTETITSTPTTTTDETNKSEDEILLEEEEEPVEKPNKKIARRALLRSRALMAKKNLKLIAENNNTTTSDYDADDDIETISDDVNSNQTDNLNSTTDTLDNIKSVSATTSSASIASSQTSVTVTTNSTGTEELRQRILADWSDEENIEDHHNRHNNNNIKNTSDNNKKDNDNDNNNDTDGTTDLLLDKHVKPDANNPKIMTSPVDNNKSNNSNYNSSNSSKSIRNIPKKDRRDVILTEFNERTSTADAATTVINPIDMLSSNSSDCVVVTDELLPTPKSHSKTKISSKKIDSIEDFDKSAEIETKAIVDVVPTKIISCFDFLDEDESETQNDTLTTIAKFKKKLQSSEHNHNSATEVSSVPKDDKKDNQLSAEIDSLLEQTSATVCDVKALQQTNRRSGSSGKEDFVAVAVKGLPIKERGKRFFKSRNLSHTETINATELVEDQVKAKCDKENEVELATDKQSISTNGNGLVELQTAKNELEKVPTTTESSTSTPTNENSSVSEADAEFGSPTSMLDDERLPLATTKETKEANEKSEVIETPKQISEVDKVVDEVEEEEEEEDIESPPHEELSGNEMEKEPTVSEKITTPKKLMAKSLEKEDLKDKLASNNNFKSPSLSSKRLVHRQANNENHVEMPKKSNEREVRKLGKDCEVLLKRTKWPNEVVKKVNVEVEKPTEEIDKTKTTIVNTAGKELKKRCEVLLRKTKMPHVIKNHVDISKLTKEAKDASSSKYHKYLMTKLENEKPARDVNKKITTSNTTDNEANEVCSSLFDIKSMPLLAEQSVKSSTSPQKTHKRKLLSEDVRSEVVDEPKSKKPASENNNNNNNNNNSESSHHEKGFKKVVNKKQATSAAAAATGGHKQSGSIACNTQTHNNNNNDNNDNVSTKSGSSGGSPSTGTMSLLKKNNPKVGGKRKLKTADEQLIEKEEQVPAKVCKTVEKKLTQNAQELEQVVVEAEEESVAVKASTLNTFEVDEPQLMQLQNDEPQVEPTSKILAVPSQGIPGYSDTFLLCTLVNNTYKPINNVPLYLDHDLNQLVPIPEEALIGQPNLVVNQPPQAATVTTLITAQNGTNEETDQSTMKPIIAEATSSTDITDATQLLNSDILATNGVNVSTVLTPAIVSSNNDVQAELGTADENVANIEDVIESTTTTTTTTTSTSTTTTDTSLPIVFDENMQNCELTAAEEEAEAEAVENAEAEAVVDEINEMSLLSDDVPHVSGETDQLVSADNAIILTVEGQQIIIDAATFAQLLANPDANTQLITDEGTEFVLTREVLAALELQHEAALQPQANSPSSDLLAVALAGTDLYGTDVLEIDTTQGLQLVCSDGNIAFQPGPHLTPPMTAQTNETNALLNQTPIMSTLETPTSLAGAAVNSNLSFPDTTAAEDEDAIITPNLEDSLAVIGVTPQASTIPTSLELPITVTNPAIAPRVSLPAVLPVSDTIMQLAVQPSASVIAPYNDSSTSS